MTFKTYVPPARKPMPYNDRSRSHAERRALLASHGVTVGPPPSRDWGLYHVQVCFPDHPQERWRKGVTMEVTATSEEKAVRKALSTARRRYGLSTRLRGAYREPKRISLRDGASLPGPRWALILPSPLSVANAQKRKT